MNVLRDAALERAQAGAYVLPVWWTEPDGRCACPKGATCPSPGKHPLTAQGIDDASNDPVVIERWWTNRPRANVAVRTDTEPRIDIDLVEVAEALLADIPLRAETEVVRTPRGGLHIAFRTELALPSQRLMLADGRALGDFKAARGYVLVPPSTIGSRSYRIVSGSPLVMAHENPIEWLRAALPLFNYDLARETTSRAYTDLGGTVYEGRGRHNALVSYAGKVWVVGMAPATLVRLLNVINDEQCSPPLPDDELHEIAEHFINRREPRPEAIIGEVASEDAHQQLIDEEYSFTPATRSTFVKDFVEWRSLANDAALEYAEAHALASLAAVVGPRLRIPVRQKPQPIACNLCVVLIGPSTVSRKSDVQDHTYDLVQEVAPEHVMDAPGSAEGFVQDLALHQQGGGVLFVDELAWWFAGVKRKTYLAEMKGYVMRAYDGTPISRRNRSKRRKQPDGSYTMVEDADIAKEPCLSMLGTSTPERLAQVSTGEDIEDGWWPRWIIVWPKKRPPMRPMGPPDDEVSGLRERVVKRLHYLHQRLRGGAQAILDDAAWQRANAIFMRMEEQALDDTDHGSFYSRMELRVLKVAALLAAAEDDHGTGNIIVKDVHIDDADALCQRWLEDALRFADTVGLNEFEYALNKAWMALQRFKERRAPRRSIARAAHVSARVMDEIERTLQDRGLIDVVEVATNGRTQKVWEAAA